MFKKILSLAVALMIVMSMAAIAASAAQVEISENAADTPAEVGAESGAEVGADGGADTGAEGGAETAAGGKVIYFDTNSCGWNDGEVIILYCYDPSGDEPELIPWGSNKKGGMTNDGTGICSYDFEAKGIELQPGKQYSLIFNHNGLKQTHDLLFDESCFGDTATADPNTSIENPADYQVTKYQLLKDRTRFTLRVGNMEYEIESNLVARFNIYNLTCNNPFSPCKMEVFV